MKLPTFNKNLAIGILLLVIFVLLGIFGCVSMTGGGGNPLCPPCDTNTTPTLSPQPTTTPDTNADPTPTPTPTPEGYIPTPTPTPTPIDSCSTYNAETCLAWAIAEDKPHFGMATSLDDCVYNVGDSYCNDIFQSWVELSDYDPAPECCCIWKCSGE